MTVFLSREKRKTHVVKRKPCDDTDTQMAMWWWRQRLELCSYKSGKADDHQKLRQESTILPRTLFFFFFFNLLASKTVRTNFCCFKLLIVCKSPRKVMYLLPHNKDRDNLLSTYHILGNMLDIYYFIWSSQNLLIGISIFILYQQRSV